MSTGLLKMPLYNAVLFATHVVACLCIFLSYLLTRTKETLNITDCAKNLNNLYLLTSKTFSLSYFKS